MVDWHDLVKKGYEDQPELVGGILFPPKKDTKRTFGRKFIKDWRKIFNNRVHNSPNFDLMCLHVLLGQLPNIKKLRYTIGNNPIDLRVSGCLFQGSGSTKGMGFNFINQIAKELHEQCGIHMKYEIVTDFTANGLIGTSVQKDVRVPHPSKPGKTIKKKIDTVDPGIIHHENKVSIVACQEASSIFDNSKVDYYRNSMLYMQIAMNTMETADNIIKRKIGFGEPVVTSPNCSFLLTSYPPENLYEVVIRRGFLQRMFIVYNDVSFEERFETMYHSNEVVNKPEPEDYALESLVNRLLYINKYYEGKTTLDVADDVLFSRGGWNHITKQMEDLLRTVPQRARKKLEEFAPRFNELAKTLSFHHAIMRLSDKVEMEDVDYADTVIISIWRKILVLIEDNLKEPYYESKDKFEQALEIVAAHQRCKDEHVKTTQKKYADALITKTEFDHNMKLLNAEYVPKAEVRRELQKRWKFSQPTIDKKIEALIETGVFKKVRKSRNNADWLQLVRKPIYGE